MCKNCDVIMKAIANLKDEGKLSNKKAKLLRKGVAQIAELLKLNKVSADAIKDPIFAISKFVESQRIRQVKHQKIAGRRRCIRKVVYIPSCFKYPDAKPFCI